MDIDKKKIMHDLVYMFDDKETNDINNNIKLVYNDLNDDIQII